LSLKELENGKKPNSRNGDEGSNVGTSNGEVSTGEGAGGEEEADEGAEVGSTWDSTCEVDAEVSATEVALDEADAESELEVGATWVALSEVEAEMEGTAVELLLISPVLTASVWAVLLGTLVEPESLDAELAWVEDPATEASEELALTWSPAGTSVWARADPASSSLTTFASVVASGWYDDWVVLVLEAQGIQVVVVTTVTVVKSRSLTERISEQHIELVVGWVWFA
jgi:hypothetical protein